MWQIEWEWFQGCGWDLSCHYNEGHNFLPGEPLLDSVEQTTANQIAYFAHVLSGGGWLSRKQKGPAKRSLTDSVVKVLLEVAVPWDCLWYDP